MFTKWDKVNPKGFRVRYNIINKESWTIPNEQKQNVLTDQTLSAEISQISLDHMTSDLQHTAKAAKRKIFYYYSIQSVIKGKTEVLF